ncbi:F-box only protein 40 [Megalops cyprinoides]|uniref:F-box only protein 40 n=1 Tax=Megalops cyprinoides TaxID=118141 RepID=UPI001863A86B|nr:F-box only protein 40 [Megalops cyprinoides]
MGRHKKAPTGQHKHCEKCFNQHCTAPVEVSVSCVVINCRLLCGAVFHMCKEEEHQLLCPYQKVPCLNASFGCPFSMCRYKLAKHLEVCPASVVSCSLDWNRWPVAETDTTFYKSVLKEPGSDEQLDLSMAVRDQNLLFHSLKMKSLFPELMEREEKPTPEELEGAVGGMDRDEVSVLPGDPLDYGLSEAELTQEEREALAKSKEVTSIENYTSWEGMFSKELGSCQQTVKYKPTPSDGKESKASSGSHTDCTEAPKLQEETATTTSVDVNKTGLAPWQDGVLERLGKEVNIAEYNMYLVHHGSMLIRFGQLAACTPKERDFVYGNLEPIEVQTLNTFSVPISYTAKRNYLQDPSTRAKREDKGVDTSDLGVSQADLPKWDEVYATLLCSLEKELRGHPISETVGTDGLFVDIGTQTYEFCTAPFKADTSLADITADRALTLHVQIQTECVTRRHNKASSAFTFLCNHFFRRDEFASHFKNVHSDIQSCLNGWFEQRCPLAYLGCTYSQKRFQPSTHRATVTYNQEFSTFNIRPEIPALLFEGVKAVTPERKRARNLDSLSKLPFEILQHIAGFLDSLTLSQLAQVSRLMRDVCATLLQERGMVSLKWEKKIYSHGGSSWKCRKKVWQFSSLFSTVERWSFDSIPSMSEHLKVCPFYEIEDKSEPVALVSMSDKQEGKEQDNLVTMFLGNN